MNSKDSFIETLTTLGYTEAQAKHVYDVYIKERIIKLDGVAGGYTLAHGAFLDKEVIDNALKYKL